MSINIDSLIYDDAEKRTVNGLPAGLLSPDRARLLQKPQELDVMEILSFYHDREKTGVLRCNYSNSLSDGVHVVDGNPKNFLISNLEPINREYYLDSPTRRLPKCTVTRTFQGPDGDLELEFFGVPAFVLDERFKSITFPKADERFEHAEAGLLVVWNHLTRNLLLKGLQKVKVLSSDNSISISISSRDVLELTMFALSKNG